MEAECWVFDLDNTLYPATSGVFAQVDRKMTRFIADFLGIDLEEAGTIRKTYYLEHGTTLSGLMALHGMKPKAFLDYVHDIDLGEISPDQSLDKALSRLTGRKIIYTNGPTDHAERILERLSIGHHFEAVFDIIGADYIPKPKQEPFDVLVSRFEITPSKTVMVEDLARNLEPAAARGMTTVWVKTESEIDPNQSTDHVDHVVDDLVHWLDALTGDQGLY